MSAARKPVRKAPRPVGALTMVAVQVDQPLRVVEALAELLLNVMTAARDSARDDTPADGDRRLTAAVEAGIKRLAMVLRGEL